jgi:drug/metabolite transporter (DMT)-like permease
MNIVMLMYLSVFLGILSGKVFFQEKIHANLILYAVVAFIGIILTLSTGEFTLHV